MNSAAARMADIAPFHVMELMAKAQALEAQGRSIIHMEVGEPGFATAAPIIAAAQRFLAGGHVHYTAAMGLPALREAIAQHYRQRFAVDIDPARIAVTAGASGALLLALAATTNPGDEWLLPDPGYPCNRNFVRLVEGMPRALPVEAAACYQPTPPQVAQAWCQSTRGLMVASPANPTGTVVGAEDLRALWQLVAQRGGELIVDEIYQGLTYGADDFSAATLDADIFVINSFSKYFGMTGWRLGWLVVPPARVRDIEKLAQNLYICPSTVAQHAALAAFEPETLTLLEARRDEFRRRRDMAMPRLRRMGFNLAVEPQGAFYLYADSSALAADSFALALRLLEEAGVAATPGLDFGANRPAAHMRFAYTAETADIEEGLQRIERWLGLA